MAARRTHAKSKTALAAASLALLAAVLVLPGGCRKLRRTDTTPLDNVGMSFSSIDELKRLDPSNAEIAELAKTKQAGISDRGCIELVEIARGRKQTFTSGEAVTSLRQAGMVEAAILQLARLGQLGEGVGELMAMRLAGLSDATILELAGRRAQGQPALSGASLAELKNAGLSEATLDELLRRGVTDDQAHSIIALCRRGARDAEILRRFPAS